MAKKTTYRNLIEESENNLYAGNLERAGTYANLAHTAAKNEFEEGIHSQGSMDLIGRKVKNINQKIIENMAFNLELDNPEDFRQYRSRLNRINNYSQKNSVELPLELYHYLEKNLAHLSFSNIMEVFSSGKYKTARDMLLTMQERIEKAGMPIHTNNFSRFMQAYKDRNEKTMQKYLKKIKEELQRTGMSINKSYMKYNLQEAIDEILRGNNESARGILENSLERIADMGMCIYGGLDDILEGKEVPQESLVRRIKKQIKKI